MVRAALLSPIVLAASLLLAALDVAGAYEYRKCHIRFVVSGSGLSKTEVPGADFWAWGRGKYQARWAWQILNGKAKHCATKLASSNRNTLPAECAANENDLRNASAIGRGGITGLSVTRFRTLLKKTICARHQRANSRVRTISDTREIEGLTVGIEPMGNSTACHSRRVLGPQFVTLHCRQAGRDSQFEWFYKK
ncbi:MAG: hypothetical protein NXI27_27735 [Alphaproteobacteria bacterium]|nr:hypothetical protein [Alphaproteobacteria bacterium]